jgi:phage terminase small subunit
MDFLSVTGNEIFQVLLAHCRAKLKMMDIDEYELKVLANSFDVYSRAAKICNDEGFANVHSQIRAEYTVMKTEHGNILKHSGKFGLNPGDRDKLFKKLKEEKEKKGFDTGMKVTKTA